MRYASIFVVGLLILVGGGANAQMNMQHFTPQQPVAPQQPSVQAAPAMPQVVPAPAEAARIHRTEDGKWAPDPGCHWRSSDPDDLEVYCD